MKKRQQSAHPASPPKPQPSLARRVGALPLPPTLGKPPVARVMKPLLAAPPKPSVSKPHPPKPNKPVSPLGATRSVAGKLGSFAAKRPR